MSLEAILSHLNNGDVLTITIVRPPEGENNTKAKKKVAQQKTPRPTKKKKKSAQQRRPKKKTKKKVPQKKSQPKKAAKKKKKTRARRRTQSRKKKAQPRAKKKVTKKKKNHNAQNNGSKKRVPGKTKTKRRRPSPGGSHLANQCEFIPGQLQPRFRAVHLDQDSDSNETRLALTRHGFDVTSTSDQRLSGASDQKQLSFARSDKRVVITHDHKFLVDTDGNLGKHCGVFRWPHALSGDQLVQQINHRCRGIWRA